VTGSMELRTTAYLDPFTGQVMFLVKGNHCEGLVDAATGQYRLSGAPCRITEAVTRSLAEWYDLDRRQYGGANYIKVERALRRL